MSNVNVLQCNLRTDLILQDQVRDGRVQRLASRVCRTVVHTGDEDVRRLSRQTVLPDSSSSKDWVTLAQKARNATQ